MRDLWHHFYFHFAKKGKGVDLAMRCQDVAQLIDLNEKQSWTGWFRIRLHFSLCQACANYYKFSNFLKSKTINLKPSEPQEMEVQLLNKKLKEKFLRSQ